MATLVCRLRYLLPTPPENNPIILAFINYNRRDWLLLLVYIQVIVAFFVVAGGESVAVVEDRSRRSVELSGSILIIDLKWIQNSSIHFPLHPLGDFKNTIYSNIKIR